MQHSARYRQHAFVRRESARSSVPMRTRLPRGARIRGADMLWAAGGSSSIDVVVLTFSNACGTVPPGTVSAWSTTVTPENCESILGPRIVALAAQRWCIVRAPGTAMDAFTRFVDANHRAAAGVCDTFIEWSIAHEMF